LNGGKTWSERKSVPENWATSQETPTIHRLFDPRGKERLIVWSGLYPARIAHSTDSGKTWSPLEVAGDWGGIVVMGSVEKLRSGKGHYMAFFHDDGRFFRKPGSSKLFSLYTSVTTDGGVTWSNPRRIYTTPVMDLCEPGVFYAPDGKTMVMLLRENSRVRNSQLMTSVDEGRTWSSPQPLPDALNGDRHTAKYLRDGRLFISYRDAPPKGKASDFAGDWVAWVGSYKQLLNGGGIKVRIADNTHAWDCAYPGVEVLPDGTVLAVTYGHWTAGEPPYILSVRIHPRELDRLALKLLGRTN
jgi:hypothetical protein